MTPKILAGFAAGASLIMTACASSPPMRFYTLTEIAPARPLVSTGAAGAAGVRVEHVAIPPELDRFQLVRRIDSTQLHIEDQDRWAGPLDEAIRRILDADVATRVAASGGGAVRMLSVSIQDFYADASCNVSLRAEWTVKPAGSAEASEVTEDIHTPPSGACTTAAVPEIMSRALAELADRLATALILR